MKIIVAGLGETGRSLIKLLEGSDHDITVIDRERSCVDAVTDRYKVNGVVGSSASADTLIKAGADTADMMIALTHADEINLLSCMQAKAVGTKYCVARLFMEDLIREEERLKEKYSIDHVIKPRVDLADEVYANIGLPGYIKIERLKDEDIYVLDLNTVGNSPLIGKTISSISETVSSDMVIGSVLRGKKTLKVKDDLEIKDGDTLYIAVKNDKLDKVLSSIGVVRDRIKHVVIVGGRLTEVYLANRLIYDKKRVTILDDDMERCRELMERFPSANVIYAEGDITEVLEEEKVYQADSVVSLTDNDETNLVISMYAWSKGISSVITRVDRQVHVKLLHRVNIDITVSPTELSVFKIIRYISAVSSPDQDENEKISDFITDLEKF
ncbi:MAG: NAD-binding protein [Lachnospiraceae bacterium]|nr:NAD-binding protein [Lachnospiraceae bacterium]